jgi:hypothetical protein
MSSKHQLWAQQRWRIIHVHAAWTVRRSSVSDIRPGPVQIITRHRDAQQPQSLTTFQNTSSVPASKRTRRDRWPDAGEKNERHTWGFVHSCFGLSAQYRLGMSSKPGTRHRTNDQIVCLLPRGYRVDEAFLSKCVRAPRGDGDGVQGLPLAGPTRPPTNCPFSSKGFGAALELPPTTPGQPPSGATGRRQLTDALALGPLCLRATLRVRTACLPCVTSTLLNTRQRCRFAQAALKSCGSLEQRRDSGTCPTFISLNAKLVACQKSRQRTSRQHERDHPHNAGRNGGCH